jgi:sugar (pentulose or hexulose) kinase
MWHSHSVVSLQALDQESGDWDCQPFEFKSGRSKLGLVRANLASLAMAEMAADEATRFASQAELPTLFEGAGGSQQGAGNASVSGGCGYRNIIFVSSEGRGGAIRLMWVLGGQSEREATRNGRARLSCLFCLRE